MVHCSYQYGAGYPAGLSRYNAEDGRAETRGQVCGTFPGCGKPATWCRLVDDPLLHIGKAVALVTRRTELGSYIAGLEQTLEVFMAFRFGAKLHSVEGTTSQACRGGDQHHA